MENGNGPIVIGERGLRGRVLSDLSGQTDRQELVIVQLEDGRQVHLPASMLVRQADGTYYAPLTLDAVERATPADRQHEARQDTAMVVPVVREELAVDKRTVETGRARITKHVREREEVVDEPLLRQEVAIEHVPINRMWQGPPPPPRYEGDKLIVSLLEEVLVVEKRLMLKEELHISRVEKTVREPQTVVLRSEDVTVERVDPSGNHPDSR